jgi:hypothetical protein
MMHLRKRNVVERFVLNVNRKELDNLYGIRGSQALSHGRRGRRRGSMREIHVSAGKGRLRLEELQAGNAPDLLKKCHTSL